MSSGKGLSKEAQEWHDLIQDVHEHQGGGDTMAPANDEPYAPAYHDEFVAKAHEFRIEAAIKRLFATAGGKVVVAAIVLLFTLLALAYIPDWGTDSTVLTGAAAAPVVDANSTQSATTQNAAPADATSGEAPKPAATDVVEAAPPAEAELTEQLIASAAGVYRLNETSVRLVMEGSAGVSRFESAEGAIVIESSGDVVGDFTYVFWGPFDNALAKITADSTVNPDITPKLALTDSGLTFDGTIVVSFLTEPPDRPAYTNPTFSSPVTGLVDVELGLLELSFAGEQGQATSFQFLR